MRALLAILTRRDLAARTAGSVGGWLWVWVPPLTTVAAYFLVFDVVFAMRVGAASPTAPVAATRVGTFLIVGMLGWMAFADAVQRGMGSLLDAGQMLQKNPLPPALFPARAVLASSCVFAPLIVLLVAAYAPAHHFRPGVWAVLPLLVGQLLLSFLMAYLLAILTAALRDVMQGVGVLLSLGVFLSPVLFPLAQFPARWRWVLWLNPMTGPVLGYQSTLLGGNAPAAAVWIALAVWLTLLALLLNVALARSRDQLVDWL
jgi:lipopolysaccharide transport system permease protein